MGLWFDHVKTEKFPVLVRYGPGGADGDGLGLRGGGRDGGYHAVGASFVQIIAALRQVNEVSGPGT